MRSKTLNRIIFLATIIISVVVITQLFWLNRIYKFDQREFDNNVIRSMKSVYDDLDLAGHPGLQLKNLIIQPDENSFICKVDSLPAKDLLINSISANMESFGVLTDCKVAVFDKKSNKYIYEVYLPTIASKHPVDIGTDLKEYQHNASYIHLYFPHRKNYIITGMVWWIIGEVVLLFVLITIGGSLFYLYKQKFLNEEQADFIKVVTHEFQTPLTTLQLGLEFLAKPTATEHPSKMAQYITLMQGQVNYLKHHIENLTNAASIKTRKETVEKIQVQPSIIIRKAIDQLHLQQQETNAKISYIDNARNVSIPAHENSLLTATLNLLSNAIKYSTDPVIDVRTEIENNMYVISVKDNGIGIDKKFQKNLFRKFYRVPYGDVHSVKGLGLGLYFVKKSVGIHNGKITVDSSPGKGSEFRIHLPLN
jgi:two-component system phosphate regulon sensor histidine kinase PhoR